MAYVPTTFVDRSVEFPNRRKLTAVPGQADTFDVARAEGTVFAEGTKPDAANLNAEFGKIKTETDSIITNLMWSDWTTVAFPFAVPNDGFLKVSYASLADTFGYLYLKSALYGYNYAVSSCIATGISDGICTPVKKGDTISIQGLQGTLRTVSFMQTHVN